MGSLRSERKLSHAALVAALLVGLSAGAARAEDDDEEPDPEAAPATKNFQPTGSNELDGGIGFALNLTFPTPGGFKFFLDYGRRFSDLFWLNTQLNITVGGNRPCPVNSMGEAQCALADNNSFTGFGLEGVGGIKLRWRLTDKRPIFVHAKVGAFAALVNFAKSTGMAFGGRGGGGVRWFLFPSFGVGAEILLAIGGSAVSNNNSGVYLALDLNLGVEWRF